jgi:integrase
MLKPKFVLKEPKATDETLIYLFINFNKQRVKVSTRIQVLPTEWDAGQQRAIGKKNVGRNATLNRLAAFVQGDVYYKLTANGGQLTPDRLKAEIEQEITGKLLSAKPTTLADFAEKLTEELTGQRAASTLQVYRSTIQHLKDYEKKSRRTYTFEKIDLDFYNGFTSHLENAKGHSTNTVGKVIKTIKSFLAEAAERKLHTSLDYKSKRFKVEKEETDAIYLTVPELAILAELDIKPSPLADVRDIFVLGAFTGLRFSDLTQLSNFSVSGVAGRKTLKIRTKKTDTQVVIPLHPIAESIMHRNEGHPPKSYTNAATNRLLKQLAQLAGFTEHLEVNTATGKQVKQKWQLITTHTARRSLATNAYLAGVSIPAIMALTGHRKVQTFMLYIRITAQENADNLLQHSFFQNS